MSLRCFFSVTASLLFLSILSISARAEETWHIALNDSYKNDEAIRVCIEDLIRDGEKLGIHFEVTSPDADLKGNTIAVGGPQQNNLTADLLAQGQLELQELDSDQGYEIRTLKHGESRILVISGGSLLGDVYGLYWIWDRMRVDKEIPKLNLTRVPALPIRHPPQAKGGPAKTKEGLRSCLRHGLTWVSGENPLNLISWDSEFERSENQKKIAETKELIDYAHALHLKYFTYGDEFTYHPSLLKECGAKVSLSDPAFWKAIQEKYRKLLNTLPEIDGVGIRTGESTQNWGNYEIIDIMHMQDQAPEWTLEKRYRTFVKKIHEVVVGEFNKLYYHRTWVTSDSEQHTNPEVFSGIFTNEIPVKNLFIEPKITLTDRWYYQPFNPTFNLTPHSTIVEFEAMEYHTSGPGLFASFPGPYYQRGLKTVLKAEPTNVTGLGFDAPAQPDWGTGGVTAYTALRLAWNPYENLRTIAEDFAAIHFGKAAAKPMGKIYMLSSQAYKDGIYIKPVAESKKWNTLPHLRDNIFPMQGIPEIDYGKAHLDWLASTMIKPCLGREKETVRLLDRGLETSERMLKIFKKAKSKIEPQSLADEVQDALDSTYALIRTNNLYVKICFAYFNYRNDRNEASKRRLQTLAGELQQTKEHFYHQTAERYRLFGIDQLLACANMALEDLEKAETILAKAPSMDEIDTIIEKQQNHYNEILREHGGDAIQILQWEGSIDGRDMLYVSGDNLDVKHIRDSPINHMKHKFINPLPQQEVTVVVRNIESRPRHPFVLEQPTAENGYRATIYLEDSPGGPGKWNFELYVIPKQPEALNLKRPW